MCRKVVWLNVSSDMTLEVVKCFAWSTTDFVWIAKLLKVKSCNLDSTNLLNKQLLRRRGEFLGVGDSRHRGYGLGLLLIRIKDLHACLKSQPNKQLVHQMPSTVDRTALFSQSEEDAFHWIVQLCTANCVRIVKMSTLVDLTQFFLLSSPSSLSPSQNHSVSPVNRLGLQKWPLCIPKDWGNRQLSSQAKIHYLSGLLYHLLPRRQWNNAPLPLLPTRNPKTSTHFLVHCYLTSHLPIYPPTPTAGHSLTPLWGKLGQRFPRLYQRIESRPFQAESTQSSNQRSQNKKTQISTATAPDFYGWKQNLSSRHNASCPQLLSSTPKKTGEN